jgi:hypothetical protein
VVTHGYGKQKGEHTVSIEEINALVDGTMALDHRASEPTIIAGPENALSQTMMGIAIVWGTVAAALGAAGLLSKGLFQRAGILALWIVTPVIAFVGVFAFSSRVRAWAFAFDQRLIILFNVIRFAGAAFLTLYAQRQLAPSFALTAGWMDVIVGVTAPVAAFYLAPARTALRRGLLLAWMVFGVADFAISLPLGAVARRRAPASMVALNRFPVSLIPTFFVPLALIGYVILGAQLWRQRRSA